MVEKSLTAMIQEAYIQGISNRSVDDLVKAFSMEGISKSQASRMCGEIDERVHAFLTRPDPAPRLSTAAFAGKANNEPFPLSVKIGSNGRTYVTMLPETGGLPTGALNGTPAYAKLQSVNRWMPSKPTIVLPSSGLIRASTTAKPSEARGPVREGWPFARLDGYQALPRSS